MNRRWIALAVVVVAIIAVANIVILLILVPRWSKAASNIPPAASTQAAAQPAAAVQPAAVVSAPVAAPPANGNVATSQPVTAVPHHPKPPAVQPGMHLERQVLTPSGQLRVRYLRDRQQGIREITLQEVKNPANETVLAQYKRNAWVVVSPNDDWIILENRDKGNSGVQLFQRLSTSPLKYEVPQELRTSASELRDMIWQAYLNDTQQDPNLDARRVTIDATGWEPDSQKVTLSIAPVPTKDNSEVPVAWTCFYNVNTRQLEPAEAEVAEGPPNDNQNAAPEETTSGAPNEMVAGAQEASAPDNAQPAENGETAAPNDQNQNQSQDLEGEKFPATREQEITVADANELELADVKYAIFEMFARHGAQIDDAKMKKAFSQFSWYQAREGLTFDEAEKEFSDIEKHNLEVLRRVRAAKIAATRRPERRAIKGEPVQQPSNGERFIRGVLQGVSDALNGGDQ